MLQRKRHNHTGHFGSEVVATIDRNHTLLTSLVQKELNMVVDESTQQLLLRVIVTSVVVSTSDHSLKPHLISLVKHLLLTFKP